MSDLVVYTAMTSRRGLYEQYARQLKAADIPFYVEDLTNMPNNMGHLRMKVEGLKRVADRFKNQKIIISDAWDVLFYGTKGDVLAKIPDSGVLCAAERVCWPDGYLADHFPNHGTPWRYFNGGLLAGKAEDFWVFADACEKSVHYFPEMVDQQWFNHRVMRKENEALGMRIDTHTSLFYCLIEEKGELEFINGRPHNSISDTWPNFLHANGKIDTTSVRIMGEFSALYGEMQREMRDFKASLSVAE